MGRPSRDKGARRERELASLIGGERVPLSGSAGGSFAGDVRLPNGWIVEVKARAAGFKTLYQWLQDRDLLALRADRQQWLIVMPLDRFLELRGVPEDFTREIEIVEA